MNELSPCPFCGATDMIADEECYPPSIRIKFLGILILIYFKFLKRRTRGFVECITQGCDGFASGSTLEEAIEKWNTRYF